MSVPPKVIYRFSAFPIKVSVTTLNSQDNLEKEEQTGGITLPNFKLYYKVTVIKMV